MSHKEKEKMVMNRNEAGRFIEKLGKGLVKEGSIKIKGKDITLPDSVDVEIEFKEKQGRCKFEVELEWIAKTTEPASGITETTPGQKGESVVKIADLSELSPWKAKSFSYPSSRDDAILIALPGNELRAYSTICTHKGKCVKWDEETQKLVCPAHGAIFDPATGVKLKGPGEGPLTRVRLEIRENSVYAVGIEAPC